MHDIYGKWEMAKREKKRGAARNHHPQNHGHKNKKRTQHPQQQGATDDIEEQLKRQRAKQKEAVENGQTRATTSDEDQPRKKELGDYVYDEERQAYFPKRRAFPQVKPSQSSLDNHQQKQKWTLDSKTRDQQKSKQHDLLTFLSMASSPNASGHRRAQIRSRWAGHEILSSSHRHANETINMLGPEFMMYVSGLEELKHVEMNNNDSLPGLSDGYSVSPWSRTFGVLPHNPNQLPHLAVTTVVLNRSEFWMTRMSPSSPLWKARVGVTTSEQEEHATGIRFTSTPTGDPNNNNESIEQLLGLSPHYAGIMGYVPSQQKTSFRLLTSETIRAILLSIEEDCIDLPPRPPTLYVNGRGNDFCFISPETVVMACDNTQRYGIHRIESVNVPVVLDLHEGDESYAVASGFGSSNAIQVEPNLDAASGAMFGHLDGSISLWDQRSPRVAWNTGEDRELLNVLSMNCLSPQRPHQWLVRGSRGLCRLYDFRKSGSHTRGDPSNASMIHQFSVPDNKFDLWRSRACSGLATDPSQAIVLSPYVTTNNAAHLAAWSLYSGEYIGSKSIVSYPENSSAFYHRVELSSSRTSAWQWLCSEGKGELRRLNGGFGLWVHLAYSDRIVDGEEGVYTIAFD